MASKYRNTGQTCVCANRLFVHAAVYDAFAEKLCAAVAKLQVGDGLQGATDQGPLIDATALAKVEEHVADALEMEEHTSELPSIIRISYAVFCLKKKKPATVQARNKAIDDHKYTNT